MLRECLQVRQNKDPADWRTANARTMLGEALLRQRRIDEAKPLLIEGYEGLMAARNNIPETGFSNLPDAIDRLILLAEMRNRLTDLARWKAERARYPREESPRARPIN